MEIIEREMNGVFEIRLSPIRDDRGFFMRVMDLNSFNEYGINKVWVQENHSCNVKKGIVRGLHFQFPPYTETKLVRAVSGEVLDVFVDLREDSPTFGKWGSIVLSEHKYNAIYIPRGFAHGFCTLTEHSEIIYKVDNFYSKEYESGIIWNDPDISIGWPTTEGEAILSERDKHHPTLKDFLKDRRGICKY